MNVRSIICIFLFAVSATLLRAQSAGSVTGWGDGTLGQLPTANLQLTNIVAVSAGTAHSVGLRSDGTVVVWGSDTEGQRSKMPAGLSGVRAIAAGGYHTLALLSNGTVRAWGMEGAQTNVPPAATGVRAVAAGEYFSMALKSNGTIVVWGAIGSVPSAANGVAAIAAGVNHALALRSDNVVVAWGGFGNHTNVPSTLRATQIAAGESHSLALTTAGAVVGWGNNTYGQSTNASAPASGVRSIFAGRNHSGALRNNGVVLCWGDNTHQQRTVPSITNVTAVVSGGPANHNLAITLERPSIETQPLSQSVGLGQNATFTVVAAGSPPLHFQWRKNGVNLTAANAASYFVNDAEESDAGGYSVVVTNSVGSVTSVVAVLTVNSAPVITSHPQSATVAVNGNATFMASAGGTAPLHYQWRKDGTNIPGATAAAFEVEMVDVFDAGAYSVVVSNLYGTATSSNAVLTVVPGPGFATQPDSQVALLGSSVTLRAVVTNALAYQWVKNGTNIPGATSTNLMINRAQPGDAGTYALRAWNNYGTNTSSAVTLGVQSSGVPSDLVLWGENAVVVDLDYIDMTPPAGVTNISKVAMGFAHNLALRANGSVVGWGNNQFGQAGLPPGVVATAIAAGANHTLAITNGKVGAWGLNDAGQASPPDIAEVTAIAAGGEFSLALRSNGMVSAWGNAPITPAQGTNLAAIAAGMEHVLAVRRDGSVLAWGGNTHAQVRAPFSVTNVNAAVRQVAAGAFHSLALKSNGTVVAWGKGTWGQTNVPPEATNIVAIAAGSEHSVALRADGAVICWGYNNWGQTETPANLIASGIAAAGERTLAIGRQRIPSVITITPVQDRVHIIISSLNGMPFNESHLPQVSVWAGPDLTGPANWAPLTNALSVTNGALLLEDTRSEARRFYRLQMPP